MAAMRSSLVGDLIDPFLSKIVLGKALSQLVNSVRPPGGIKRFQAVPDGSQRSLFRWARRSGGVLARYTDRGAVVVGFVFAYQEFSCS